MKESPTTACDCAFRLVLGREPECVGAAEADERAGLSRRDHFRIAMPDAAAKLIKQGESPADAGARRRRNWPLDRGLQPDPEPRRSDHEGVMTIADDVRRSSLDLAAARASTSTDCDRRSERRACRISRRKRSASSTCSSPAGRRRWICSIQAALAKTAGSGTAGVDPHGPAADR